MGFALWVDEEMAWAQGRHEYQPTPPSFSHSYVGLFASLGDMNAYLEKRRSGEWPSHKVPK